MIAKNPKHLKGLLVSLGLTHVSVKYKPTRPEPKPKFVRLSEVFFGMEHQQFGSWTPPQDWGKKS